MGRKYLTSVAGGWHVFLDGLAGAADGIRTPGGIEREKALRPSYEAQLAGLSH